MNTKDAVNAVDRAARICAETDGDGEHIEIHIKFFRKYYDNYRDRIEILRAAETEDESDSA
jgi:hypothetical protein